MSHIQEKFQDQMRWQALALFPGLCPDVILQLWIKSGGDLERRLILDLMLSVVFTHRDERS